MPPGMMGAREQLDTRFTRYQLYAVVVHSGGPQSGHYTAKARDLCGGPMPPLQQGPGTGRSEGAADAEPEAGDATAATAATDATDATDAGTVDTDAASSTPSSTASSTGTTSGPASTTPGPAGTDAIEPSWLNLNDGCVR